MVSAGKVSGDRSDLKSGLKSAKTALNGIGSSWQGTSHDTLTDQFDNFYSQVKVVLNDMDSFKKAVSLYKEYEEAKKEWKHYKKLFNGCEADDPSRGHYKREKNEAKDEMDKLKKKIIAALNSISGVNGGQQTSAITNSSLQGIDGLTTAGNIVPSGDYMMINFDYDNLIQTFGGQLDSVGYPANGQGCDNYSRLYALYIASGGKVKANNADLGTPYDGFTKTSIDAADGGGTDAEKRKRQAEIAYEAVKRTGIPCVIHVNSSTGNGHWMTVVGYKKGVTKANVTIGDLIVVDSAAHSTGNGTSAKVRPVSDDKYNCMDGNSYCNSSDSAWENVSFTPNS